MTETYKIFGSEMSPYSIKVRSYFRYKSIPHQWIPRTRENEGEYRGVARLPIVPTVVSPEGEAMQDSTPIIEALEATFPAPSIHPDSPDLRFLSELLEEFGDEWGNKLMFHHRWWDEVDQRAAARTLARLNLPRGTPAEVEAQARLVLERMSQRGHFVGSNPATAPLITGYFLELLDILEVHLSARQYLLGGRPAFGDFGLAAQIYEASIDPTCSGMIRARGPHVLDWCLRMIAPRDEGAFENWPSLSPTLAPLLAYVGRYFLPWSEANARALKAGAAEFSVALAGETYSQGPQKYHAKSLEALREKYRLAPDRAALDPILEAADCARYLASANGPGGSR